MILNKKNSRFLQSGFFPDMRIRNIFHLMNYKGKGKGLPQEAEVAQGVPGSLRPRNFLTFGTTRVLGRQPYASAAFTSGEIPGTHF
jgi:hypothetical protein